jgi:hypothetical protein
MMSEWSRSCFNADLDKMKTCLEKDPAILDSRESTLRLNGLLHVIAGVAGRMSYLASSEDIAPFKAPPSMAKQYVKAICYLVEKGSDIHSRNAAGHTALHMVTYDYVSELDLQVAEVLIALGADVNARYRLRPLKKPC